MGYYTQQEFDFVQRTKKILQQYDSIDFSKNESEKYEITLLLNCFVGLLILPKEHWYDKLPKTEIDEEGWGINPDFIENIEGDSKSIQQVARRLRNSITHYRFKVFSNKKEEIASIEFKDCDKGKSTFKSEIPIENIKLFLEKLSDWFLLEMKK